MPRLRLREIEHGFTIVELLIACLIFPIIAGGIYTAYGSVRNTYRTARQLNEIYAVISACPEVDRALEFNSVSSTTNCFPNNSFKAEGGGVGATVTYSPTLTVTNTSALPASDPLQTVYDSKVIDVSVGYPNDTSSPPLKLRLLITRNGIGQL
jgi:prepilin-type N-terminal cleavage/methylation domain-containing protein